MPTARELPLGRFRMSPSPMTAASLRRRAPFRAVYDLAIGMRDNGGIGNRRIPMATARKNTRDHDHPLQGPHPTD